MSGHRIAATAVLAAAAVVLLANGLSAQGHGPVYGLSTPTLGRGEWSLDVAAMGRFAGDDGSAMLRPMLSYGLTEDLQLSASVPVPLLRGANASGFRGFTRMPATRDVEMMLGWRVQRRGLGVGARQETTVWLALDVPVDEQRAGIDTAPGVYASLVTGYASRSVYLWVGGAYQRPLVPESARDQPGDIAMGSVVVGYRPPAFRADYPHPDWRAFVEVVGERVGRTTAAGEIQPATGGEQLYAALTLLGLYGSWGLAGGPAFPIVQRLNGDRPEDGLRFAVNVTFWF